MQSAQIEARSASHVDAKGQVSKTYIGSPSNHRESGSTPGCDAAGGGLHVFLVEADDFIYFVRQDSQPPRRRLHGGQQHRSGVGRPGLYRRRASQFLSPTRLHEAVDAGESAGK